MELIKAGKDGSIQRADLIKTAARVLIMDPTVAMNIATGKTEAFVHIGRKFYRQSGFNFNDNDLRAIHMELRRLVKHWYVQQMLNKPVIGGVVPERDLSLTPKKRIIIESQETGSRRREERNE